MLAVHPKMFSRTLPVFAFAIVLAGQPLPNIENLPRRDEAGVPVPESRPADSTSPSGYVLGPDDQIAVWAPDCGDISGKPISIDLEGYITLPLVGRVKASGLTPHKLEAEIVSRLRRYVLNPQVVVAVAEFRSQPVSVLGSVNQPGIQQLHGRKTLVEVLSMAGGLRTDAGYSVKMTRSLEWGRIPLANSKDDSTGHFSVAEVSLKSIMTAKNPEENIVVRPHDVVSVPRADLIYVVGEVTKAGGFVMEDRQTISVLQALSLAGGLTQWASKKNSTILRDAGDGSKRSQISVDLSKILTGQAEDLRLKSNDILFVPINTPKRATIRVAETALQAVTGIVVFRGSGRQ